MKEKDIIVRLSGENAEIVKAFEEIVKKSTELGLIGEDLQIKKVPDKVEKSKLRNKSASDIMVKVSGGENTIEAFMADVIASASENLGLETPSTAIKLSGSKHNEKDK